MLPKNGRHCGLECLVGNREALALTGSPGPRRQEKSLLRKQDPQRKER
jgi:hypothetical protein